MLRDWWGEEQPECLEEWDFLAAVFNFQTEQRESLFELLPQDFQTGAAPGPFASPRADIKPIVWVCWGWSTFREVSRSPGNWAEWRQIKGSAGKHKAAILEEQQDTVTLLSPLLNWKQTWACRRRNKQWKLLEILNPVSQVVVFLREASQVFTSNKWQKEWTKGYITYWFVRLKDKANTYVTRSKTQRQHIETVITQYIASSCNCLLKDATAAKSVLRFKKKAGGFKNRSPIPSRHKTGGIDGGSWAELR